jgi:hypothetical protein
VARPSSAWAGLSAGSSGPSMRLFLFITIIL